MFDGVRTDRGGFMRLNDYCDVGPRGSGLRYTSSVCTEEAEETELGIRVVDAIVGKAVDGWDALMDAWYAEDTRDDV